jgi:hypothetical protein
MVPFLQWAVGTLVWVLGNAVYVDMRRRGARGFGRFAAFWVGFPVTFLWKALVKEVGLPGIDPPEDDEDELLRQIRLDRRARELREGGE